MLTLDEQIHSLTCTLLSEREALDEEKTRPEMEPQFEAREEELRRKWLIILRLLNSQVELHKLLLHYAT